MPNLIESEDVVEFQGVVTPPPDLASILAKVESGATYKQIVELSAGEARVLHNFLKEVPDGTRL